jgi:hypothetical protein
MFKQKSKIPTFFKRASLLTILAVVIVASFIALFDRNDRAYAATSSTINFQARLLTAAGNIVPDGQYNVEFKLYNVSTSGSALWTETRTSTDKVRVVNGYLTVNLGSVTGFGAINWDQDLWLTMNIGGTSVSPSWDGEMTPRLKLTAVPYAFTAGKLVGGTGANTTTLNTGTPSGTNTISLPAESGTLCIQSSANCGFALSSGGSNYIQNQNAGQQAASNFWISGTGRADTALQSSLFDTPTAAVLAIGTTNATGINLNQNTTLASGKSLTLQGSVAMQPAANSTSVFNIKTQGGANLLTLDSTNSRLGFNLGGSTVPSYAGTAGFELKGGIRLSAGSATYADDYITPLGGTVKSLINIVNYDPGAANQLIALGVPSTANTTARVISLFDARASAHQPTLAVLSPNQNEIGGFSWDGSNSAFLVKNSSSSGQIGLNINGTNRLTATTTGVGINMTPSSSYALDVTGDVNISTGSVYKINGISICSATGCTPAAGSSNYIQNGTGLQAANYYIQSVSASSVGAIIRGAASQTSSLLQLLDGTTGFTIAQFSNNGYLSLGSDSFAKAGQITINDATSGNGFATTLVVPSALTASRTITLPDENGTLCMQTAATCGFAPGTNGSYIQNQFASPQSANMYISNAGADTDVTVQIRAGATQTGDLVNFLNTSGTVVSKVKASGSIYSSGVMAVGTLGTIPISANLYVITATSTNIVAAFRGSATQTGDLSQWQANAGTVLARVTSAGGVQGSALDAASAAALGIGATNATSINLGKTASNIATTINGTALVKPAGSESANAFQVQTSGAASVFNVDTTGTPTVTVTGNLTQTGGAVSLTGNAASSVTTSAGALTITAAAASTWSTSAGNLTVQAATTNTLALQTAGAGTVTVGDLNSTTVNIGRGSDITRTINIGNAGVANATTINLGSTGTGSITNISGGTGTTALNLAAGTNGSINITTTGTGKNLITSATQTAVKSSTNSVTAFQVQDTGSAATFNVDTTNDRIGINTVAPATALDVVGAIQQTGIVTSNTVGTSANQWTKLGSCTITAQFRQCFTVLNITGGNDGVDNDNTQATVTARVKQQNAMAGAPYVDVTVNGVARIITKDDIKAVTTVNTGASTVVELWGRVTLAFEEWQYTSTINVDGGVGTKWAWTPLNGFQAALPTGTQTDTTYGTTYADTLTVTPASNSAATLNVQNATNLNMLTVDTSNSRVIIGRDDGLNGADAKLYFGDTANVANPWIGEANGTDSDILQLQGKSGINFSVATTQTNVFTLSATGAALFKNTADSTTAFQIQSQGTTPLFNIDSTTGAALHTLYATAASSGQTINITNASGTNTNGILVNRNAAGGTTTNGLNITNTAGTLTNGLAFTGTIGTDIFRSAGILTLSGAGGIATASNVSIGLVGTPGAVLHISSGAASDLFKVTDSTATAMDVFKIANDGYATFQNRANSTTAFRVLTQAGNALFTVDTTSNLVNISGAGTGLGGGRLTFGDNSYAYIGEYGTNDSDSLIIHGEEEIFMQTKYSATANLYIDGGTGRIGLNTETPTETLTVVGNANVISSAGTKAYRWRTTGTSLDFEAGGADLYLSTWTNVGMTTSQKQHIVMQTDGQMLFNSIGAASGTLNTLCINNTTKTVKIGPSATTCSTSSLRYKQNVQNMADAMGLDTINALRPVTYDYKDGSGNNQVGLIAEEVYQVLPQVVALDSEGKPNAINYEFLVANLIKGIQQQQVQINSLRQGLWNGGIVSNDTTFNSFVTFDKSVAFKGDATFDAKVGFNGKITYNPDTAGTIVMPHGKTSATITFAQPYDQVPQIMASSSDYVSIKVTDKTVNGFTITLKYPFASDVNIDWVATQVSLPNQSGANAPKVVVNEP